jgi:lysophospholipase L1-like esterase
VRWLLGGASLLAALVLAEAGLRGLAPDRWLRPRLESRSWDWLVGDPILGWSNLPGYEHTDFRINSLGFRGGEIAAAKPAGAIRIACQGDSTTFGLLRLGPEALGWDAYPALLEELLRAQGRDRVELINAGVLGYSAANGLLQLTTRLLDLDPDVLVVRFGYNDHLPSWQPALRVREPESALLRPVFYALASSRLHWLLRVAWLRGSAARVPAWSVPWLEPEAFERALRRIRAAASSRGVHLLFLDYPLRDPAFPGAAPLSEKALRLLGAGDEPELYARHARYQEILRRVASENGTPFLETASACAAAPDTCFGAEDLSHPTAAGARLIAELVRDELVRRGWLQRSARERAG